MAKTNNSDESEVVQEPVLAPLPSADSALSPHLLWKQHHSAGASFRRKLWCMCHIVEAKRCSKKVRIALAALRAKRRVSIAGGDCSVQAVWGPAEPPGMPHCEEAEADGAGKVKGWKLQAAEMLPCPIKHHSSSTCFTTSTAL